jgi:predicted ATPase/DNA-binding winged helix-turn-helix (wHTH) protein
VAATYQFGRFELNPATRQVLVDNQPAPVGARAFDVLLALIERRDRVVTKNELLDLVWPGLVVEENNLQVQVSTLRKLLGQQAIITIPGRGYRFTLGLQSSEVARSSGPSHNARLPDQITTFVGREQEIDDARNALSATRLLTLVGPGGIGKTRLALRVASEILLEYADGVWFVELAPLSDEHLVPQAVADALSVREVAGHPLIEQLARHVADRQLLLVIDNCEHVIKACAALLERLLRSGSRVRIMASSREPLRIPGEVSFPVPTLASPAADEAVGLDTPQQYPAVRLFMDRATAALPAFALNDQNAAAVTEICRRVDGIPLAIELAAARVRTLSLDNIADHLTDRLALLTSGSRNALPRHQTLRACMDWSYGLLEERERALFRRLSVFAGGWTLEAAESVGQGDNVSRNEVVDLLGRLVEKSLVVFDSQRSRYEFHQTVHEYALGRLREFGEERATRTRHLNFFLALAEETEDMSRHAEQGVWLQRLHVDYGNLIAANSWCDIDDEGANRGLRFVSAIQSYWVRRGLAGEGYLATLKALERPGAAKRSSDRCRALLSSVITGNAIGRYEKARVHLEEARSIAQELGDDTRALISVRLLGEVCQAEGDLDNAHAYLEHGVALARALGDERRVARGLCDLARLRWQRGAMESIEPLYCEALVFARRTDDPDILADVLLAHAFHSVIRGAAEPAQAMLREALPIIQKIRSRDRGQQAQDVCALFAASIGMWTSATRIIAASQAEMERMGYHRDPVEQATIKQATDNARDTLGDVEFASAQAAGRTLTYEETLAEATICLEIDVRHQESMQGSPHIDL